MVDVYFQRYTAAQARELRDEVEAIFRDSYVDAIESGKEFESPEAFMHWFDAYTDPARAGAFELVIARLADELCGQAWGWPLTAKTGWWDGLKLDEGDHATFTAENGSRTFAFRSWCASSSPAWVLRVPCTTNYSRVGRNSAQLCWSGRIITGRMTTVAGGGGTASARCARIGPMRRDSTC
ncbi:hypothetical protein [Nocardia beijingensis]|uniref:hypothetical protein n=1 Tax=Nocardia beijingensis TaxID=95162 RepID=UPI001E2A13F6|nr:hypothetical protein [Nocardia beijingensis]